jgi:DNA helicase-2/ATP-dependent DNA helicase PcrA
MNKDIDTPPNPSSDPDLLSVSQPNNPEIESQKIYNSLRSGQQKMADWKGGQLAVSAVPGAGKSTGMAATAALTIYRYKLHSRNQLVIVTFTRSAAVNIKNKICENLNKLNLPQTGFIVHTLHGLALQIAARHPELSDLNLETSTLVTLTQSHQLIRTCVEQWIINNPTHYQRILEGREFDKEETERLRRHSVLRTEVLPNLATVVIHEAKSSGLFPQDLWEISETITGDKYNILAIAAGLYENYERLLKSRNFIDYDDMILGALRVLKNPTIKTLWQKQIFAVFEDEAQDSSPLQTELLEILATDANNQENTQNIIRVGDPNQAINSTFTPADPIYFRKFCQDCLQQEKMATMAEAGRSTPIIIDAANFMLQWVNRDFFKDKNRANLLIETPLKDQIIQPVAKDDPQPNANPAPEGLGLEICEPDDIYHSVKLIVARVQELFSNNSEANAAILVRTNNQGKFIAEYLNKEENCQLKEGLDKSGVMIYEVREMERYSQVPKEILTILQFIERPHSPDFLKAALTVASQRDVIPKQLDFNAIATQSEKFLYPVPLDPPQSENEKKCRYWCCELLKARLELPIYRLIAFIGLKLKYDQTELATTDKLADHLVKQTKGSHSLNNIITNLSEIVNSERFSAVNIEEDRNEELYTKKSQLTIITMHKAKGLDWDYVFLPFLQAKIIPGELWVSQNQKFLGDFSFEEVARSQIRSRLHQKNNIPDVKKAWENAKALKTAEEYRLLYVAMTRAKKLLWMSAEKKGPFSWNNLNQLEYQKPCPLIPALKQQFPDHFIT